MKRRRATGPHFALAGASIVVTRPADSAGALRRIVTRLDGSAVGLPGIAVRASGDMATARRALRGAQNADVVVFISPAAVRFAWTLLPRLRFARATQVLAPGPGSVRALRRRGVADARSAPDRHDSEGLLSLAALHSVRRRRVALIGAPGGRNLLARELRARGARVEHISVYERTKPRLTPRHFAALERAADPLIVLFSSAEALTNLHALLPPPLFARLAAAECVVSSARLAEIAETSGFAHVHIAQSAAPAALVAAACNALARHRL